MKLSRYIQYYLIIVLILCILVSTYGDIREGYQDVEKRISFITYANSPFAQARERILIEARQTNVFNGIIKGYSPNDLDENFKEATAVALHQQRGGGYWIWKPYVIHSALLELQENEYLLYSDAGSQFNMGGLTRLNEYFKMIEPATGKSVLVMHLVDLKERVWTTSALFEYFGIDATNPIRESNQMLATVFICRKTPESTALVKKWLDVAVDKPELFTDAYNEDAKKKEPSFRENRHDQSVFSLLVKQDPYKACTIVISDEVDETDNEKAMQLPLWAKRLRS